jgi:hypothetical protein
MEFTDDQFDEILRALLRTVLMTRADVDAALIAIARAKLVPFQELQEERQKALDRIQPLLDAIDAQNPVDFLQAFQRTFPTRS